MKRNIRNYSLNGPQDRFVLDERKRNVVTYTPDRQLRVLLPSFDDLNNNRVTQSAYDLTKQYKPNSKSQSKLSGDKQRFNNHQFECFNHSHKQAKYCIVSQQIQLKYCQKCAILMASQGFLVQKISYQPEIHLNSKQHYQVQTKKFISQLQQSLAQIQIKKTKYKQDSKSVFEYYHSFISQLVFYEQQLHTKITIFMEKQRQQINCIFEKFQKNIESNTMEIVKAENEFSNIIKDIKVNLPTIESLEEEEFNPIMEEYNKILIKTMRKIRSQYDGHQEIELLIPKPDILKNLSELIENYIPYVSSTNQNINKSPLSDRQQNRIQKAKTRSSSISKKSTNIKIQSNNNQPIFDPSPFCSLSSQKEDDYALY